MKKSILLFLLLILIGSNLLYAQQTQTQKNETKKQHSSKVLFEPKSYDKVAVTITKGKEWKYYQFSEKKPLVFEVQGTTIVYFRVRLLYDVTMKGDQNFTLAMQEQGMLGMKSDVLTYSFKAKKSSATKMKTDPQLVPSAAHEFKFTVPDGKHEYYFTLRGTAAPAALIRILIREKDLKQDED